MPEGDTIHRAAAALRTALVDQQDGPLRRPPADRHHAAGRPHDRVGREPRQAPRDRSGTTPSSCTRNMRMSGSWHLYRPGEAWQRPHHEMRALIEVTGWVAVCFNAPVVETYRMPDASRHPGLGGARTRPVPRRRRPRPLRRAAARLRRSAGEPGRGAARPAGLLRRRQRVPLRGAVGRAAEPVRRRSATCPSPMPCASSTSPPSCCGPTCTTPSGSPCRASRAGSPSTGARASAASAAARRSSRAPTASHARTLYWCPGCQVRLDPAAARRRHADHGPAPGRANASSTTSPGAQDGLRPPRRPGGSDVTTRLASARLATPDPTRRFIPWRSPPGRSCSTPCTTGRGRR